MGQVLTHPDIISYLGQSRFVLWMGDVTRSEAYHVATTLQAAAYPFIALAALKFQTTAGAVAGLNGRFRLQVVTRIDGIPSADASSNDEQSSDNGLPPHVNGVTRSLLSLVSGPVERHDQALNAARREQEERDAARRLREQQDEAYHASLARDRERQREAQEQAERERVEQEQEELRKAEEQKYEEALSKWRWATLARILREEQGIPAASASSGGCKLNLRLDNGQRVVKVFPEDTTMLQLFDFVETREVAEEWETDKTTPFGSDINAIEPPAGYEHEYEFVLVSQFPRVVFDDQSVGLKEALTAHRMWPMATLIVEPRFGNEDDE
ncbi:Ubx domain-containing protein [Linderina macrospora]|uniref:Ubx domain-containing protein n=1 Tax=Linderina macrospora TaxID=4868 RepID=A0ACC1JB49_9FUNG|nr:Ubx domain-containing protein [Linderina macrospora]